jgi:pyruvate dehydrogenase E2 component (dihydrolipoamide acetyltransferase)
MSIVDVTIPQMGEGLQEARLVRFLKQPGDTIRRDEPIFEMETDKATMEIEAPVGGTLTEWVIVEGAIAPIGAVVGRIEAPEVEIGSAVVRADESMAPARAQGPVSPPPAVAAHNALVPPRTRAYARECGLADDELAEVVAGVAGKVMPADVDRWMARRAEVQRADGGGAFEDMAMPTAQRTLVYRLQQRLGEVIPASEEVEVPWEPVDAVRRAVRARGRGASGVATPFLIFAWCVAQASVRHPVFRSTYLGNGTIRRYAHLHLGIAVARDDDELVTARVEAADALGFDAFVEAATAAIRRAREGEDQATAVMQLSLSNLTGMGVTRAVPVVAGPAVGTIFLGAVRQAPEIRDGALHAHRLATVCLTFDHRMTNGVGAARFLADIRSSVSGLTVEALGPAPAKA